MRAHTTAVEGAATVLAERRAGRGGMERCGDGLQARKGQLVGGADHVVVRHNDDEEGTWVEQRARHGRGEALQLRS